MSTFINPENERIRAQSILRSFTEYEEAVKLFAPDQGDQNRNEAKTAEPAANANPNNGWSVTRVFNAIKRNRRPVVEASVRQTTSSPRQVTTSGC